MWNIPEPIKIRVGKKGWKLKKKSLKFLRLEYIPEKDHSPSKLRAKTRNGSTKEFSLDRQLLISLLNEKELMMWIEENRRKEEDPPSLLFKKGGMDLRSAQI